MKQQEGRGTQSLSLLLFDPCEGPGPFPAVLDLWGGGGMLVEYRAALLAAHGFASMAIDYVTPKITMETGKMVDVEYFEVSVAAAKRADVPHPRGVDSPSRVPWQAAVRVLQQHPRVHGSRLAMIGLSFGASVTLKLAAYSEAIKVRRLNVTGIT